MKRVLAWWFAVGFCLSVGSAVSRRWGQKQPISGTDNLCDLLGWYLWPVLAPVVVWCGACCLQLHNEIMEEK